MSDPAGHLPTSPNWRPISGLHGVWEIRRYHGPVPLRAVAVQLEERHVCVYSPVPKAGAAALQELGTLGKPVLLAPNAFHTLGLRGHIDAFPDAAVVASDEAFIRIKNKTKLPIEDLRLLEAKLPQHISLVQVPDVRGGEVWLSVRDAGRCAWIVGDAFLNLTQLPRAPMRWGMKLLRMGPGLAIGTTFKLFIKERAAYREWLLAKIAEERPTMLIPCHGQVLDDEQLPVRLERLVRHRI
jgi:hypothetical protein